MRYPTTSNDAFEYSYPDYITLHVPEEAVEQYKKVEPWSKFMAVVALKSTDPKPDNNSGTSELKCATPSISFANGELSFTCSTEGVEYITDILDADVKQHSTPKIRLTATYIINVYAKRAGYTNSDIATATLCWIDKEPRQEGMINGVREIQSLPILIQSNGSVLNITGTDAGTPISVYDTAGRMVGSTVTSGESATISTQLRAGDIGIVKIGDKAVKVLMK